MEQKMAVNQKEYEMKKLLGKGKGGYSYLAWDGEREYVLKQIHHEPCDYYRFGNKIEAEVNDYHRLLRLGIKMPVLLDNLLIYAYAGIQAWLGIITVGSVVAYASSMELFAGAVTRLAVAMGHLKTAVLYAAYYREFTGLGRRKYEGTIPVEKRQERLRQDHLCKAPLPPVRRDGGRHQGERHRYPEIRLQRVLRSVRGGVSGFPDVCLSRMYIKREERARGYFSYMNLGSGH